MGKEVKIGLAVGTCFVLLAGIWYFGFGGSTVEETADNPATKGGGTTTPRGSTPGPVGRPSESDRPLSDPLLKKDGFRKADLRGGDPGTDKKDEKLIIKKDDRFAGVNTVDIADPGAKPRTAIPTPVGPTAVGRKTHVVKAGETFWSLAQQYYGDPSKYKMIESANAGVSTLRIGATIVIPESVGRTDTAVRPGATPPTAPVLRGDEYVVKAGDRFDDIIRTKYGNLARRDEILALNKDVLHGNADVLKVRMILRLPAAGAPTARPVTPTTAGTGTARPAAEAPAVVQGGERFRNID